MRFHPERWNYLLIGVIVMALDQITKMMIVRLLPLGGEIRLFDGELLWIQHIMNSGMAFGIRFFPPLVLTIVALLAVIGLTTYVFITSVLPRGIGIPLGLIIGGASGNLIDRIIHGKVIDFICVDFPDFIMPRWPTFNVADSAILVGVTLLLIFSFFYNRSQKTNITKDDEIGSSLIEDENNPRY